MKIKPKKSESDMWMIIVFVVIALIVGGAILYAVVPRILSSGKNIDILSSCKNLEGTCQSINCGSGFSESDSGCPYDENGDGNIDDKEKKNIHCCIPNEKKK